jgi:hypothetical protein
MISLDYIRDKYDHLPLNDFVGRVGELFTTCTTSFEKFERLQTFQEPELPSYTAWMAGRKSESQHLYFSTMPSSAEMYRNAAKRQISATRVRVVERPLSSYLEWEMMTYQQTAKFGERILIRDISEPTQSNAAIEAGHDFLVFDQKHVYVNDYGTAGIFAGGWYVSDPKDIEIYNQLFSMARQSSILLGEYELLHGTATTSW